MLREHVHAGSWLGLLSLPHPNLSIEAATGEQAAIGPPRQRVHRAAMARQRLAVRPGCRVPEPNGGIISAAGERASIGGKGQALGVGGMPARPEQGAAL